MNLRRYFSALYWLLLVGFGLTSATFFWRTYATYEQLQKSEAAAVRHQRELEARLQEQERLLDRLKNDHEYVEKRIRQTLGYAKPGEYILRFEE